ncbi:MAG: GNAT family N-acetyltransferase [Pirellulales bacterium]
MTPSTMRQDSNRPVEFDTPVETIDRRVMCESDARAIAELLCTVWQQPGRTVETRMAEMLSAWSDYRGPEAQFPRSFLVRADGRAIAHAEFSPRTIGTSIGEMTIGALAGVCTHPRVRGKGLGVQLVRAAFKLVDDGTFPFALFQNYVDKQSFYEKLRARAIDNRIVNSLGEVPAKNPFWADVAMVYPAEKRWPSGDVDLRGPGY